MRFGLVHRVMTDALAALGVLAVANTSAMSTWSMIAVVVGLFLALAVPESWQSRPALRQLATIGPVVLFVVQGARLVMGRPALDAAIEFAAFLQILRLATRRGAAHDQQIIVLALLHFVAGTVIGGGLSYALCFVGFLIVAPGALVLSHLRREVEGNYRQGARDRTGLPVDVPRILRSRRVVGRSFLVATCLLSIPIFLFTAALFITFPRVGLSLLLLKQPQNRMIGFTDRVDLGEVGVLRNNPTIALRFDIPDLPEPRPTLMTLRLRGTALDKYDGRRWERTIKDAAQPAISNDVLPLFRAPNPARDRRVAIELEPIDPPVVLLPPRTVAVQLRARQQPLLGETITLQRGAEAEVRYSGADSRGLRYEAFLAGDREPLVESLSAQDRARYLGLPPDLPMRVRRLAHEWADDQPTPYLKAKAIEERLKHEFKYDTASPSAGTPQPVEHFLFESRRGHCEFFSTTMALMLREVGIPSRNVTGFVGGTYNRFGRYYAVREGDAHSWVEAYMDDPIRSWHTFDPTPTAGARPLQDTTGVYVYLRDVLEALSQRWNRYVVGYDLKAQLHLFEDVSRRYQKLRERTGVSSGVAEKVTRGPVVGAAILVLALGAYLWWRRRRPRRATEEPKPAPATVEQQQITALYQSLETALALQGIPRPAGRPPLKYAEDLVERAHPLAEDVLALTNTYLDARFGGHALDAEHREDFARRVKDIRAWKSAPDAAPSSP